MFIDAKNCPQQVFCADVVIVGGGAAGISVALSLLDSSLKVLLIESGNEVDDPETQAIYQGYVVDPHKHSPLDTYRQRRWGGSTTIWGGRCMPLDPIDFEHRAWADFCSWPIRYEDVLPYYPEANRLCEAGEFNYHHDAVFPALSKPMISAYQPSAFTSTRLERFSCPTDFGKRYRHLLESSKNVTVLLNANLTRIVLDETQKNVTALEVKTLTAKALRVEGRQFVLAVGGLEVVRILLNQPGVSGKGLGNTNDLVGRFYMCHLAGTIGRISFKPEVEVWHGYEVAPEGVYCRRRFALKEGVQREREIGNFVARLHHPRIDDPQHRTGILSALLLGKYFISYEYGKRLESLGGLNLSTYFKHLLNVLTDMTGIIRFLTHWVIRRSLAQRKFPSVIVRSKAQQYSLDFHAEQFPNFHSRITLADERDALGMRRLSVDWKYLPQDVRTVKVALSLFKSELEKQGLARFDYDPAEVETEMVRYGAYGGHHIGTTRMGEDPTHSVVDANGRLHEVNNLYIAGSSVFPTSSQANPTLTIVALALRLGEHLQHQHHQKKGASEHG